MLCAGDESGRTQQGHANAYDQDTNGAGWSGSYAGPAGRTGLHPCRSRPRAAPSGAAAPAFLARPAPPRVSPQRFGLVPPGWVRNARGGLAGAESGCVGSSWPGKLSSRGLPTEQAGHHEAVAPPPQCAVPGRLVCVAKHRRSLAAGRDWYGRTTLPWRPLIHAPRARSSACRPKPWQSSSMGPA